MQIISFDFDGVVTNFVGYNQIGQENKEVIKSILTLHKMGYKVFILSSRKETDIVKWWNGKNFGVLAKEITDYPFYNDKNYIGVTNRKIIADVYIDDKGFRYTNQNSKELIKEIIKI